MRLTLVAHGATEGTRRSVFGDTSPLLDDARVPLHRPHRAQLVLAGPEPACVRTAELLSAAEIEVIEGLRGPDMGKWTGLSLEDVMGLDASVLSLVQSWSQDPTVSPPGGESLEQHLDRIGQVLETIAWEDPGAIMVASPFTVRAACVHALHAGPQSIMHLDIVPGAQATLTRNRGAWRLGALVPQ